MNSTCPLIGPLNFPYHFFVTTHAAGLPPPPPPISSISTKSQPSYCSAQNRTSLKMEKSAKTECKIPNPSLTGSSSYIRNIRCTTWMNIYRILAEPRENKTFSLAFKMGSYHLDMDVLRIIMLESK